MKTSPKVIIIVLNFNNCMDTIECIDSLEKINYPNYEIVLVDNGSKDNSVELFKAKYSSNSKIRLLININNLGFTGGNNLAIRHLMGGMAGPPVQWTGRVCPWENVDYFLLLNNDTVVNPDFLTQLVNVAEADDKIGIVGPKIYKLYPELVSGSQTLFCAGTKTIPFLGQPFLRGNGKKDIGRYNNVEAVDYISGTALMIKKEVIEQIGLLDERFFAYFEDWDWCIRAQKQGFKCVYVPDAVIWHKGSSTIGFKSPSYYYYMTLSRILFARKHLGRFEFLFLFLPYFITYRLLLPILMLLLKGDIKSIMAIIKGMRNVPKPA
ncbi:MAG TPA: glycosyltransferase family 2 protein [Candidatus Brocadiia bacterium]|nr:glycosyltransferase family 2 protein [Candidatus Brocadiales bacterium]